MSVDLVEAAHRARGPLAGLDRALVGELVQRYRMFLHLKSMNPDLSFAPSGLLDEVWHLHMLHPRAYSADCVAILGDILDHNPGFGTSEDEETILLDKFERTEALWKATFGTEYVDEELGERCGLQDLTAVVMCDDKGKDKDKDGTKKPAQHPAKSPSHPDKKKPTPKSVLMIA
ncbi:glycine-rich domain-containing protein-like [Sphingomonas sp.]|uniref:glycine-rich domain-containing protein n=1 Tax=Sphingomonas sp. TaxID=28214 RepID=UPI002E34DDB9|nr:glycine-rich domain-containing protein-like [Sphingomonas sp.]HEX4693803.1 glycine-rich domain-containing protein-like [Sphingomonas sp.]